LGQRLFKFHISFHDFVLAYGSHEAFEIHESNCLLLNYAPHLPIIILNAYNRDIHP
jgi:hypothetical protein